jgi:hypothetical protein
MCDVSSGYAAADAIQGAELNVSQNEDVFATEVTEAAETLGADR